MFLLFAWYINTNKLYLILYLRPQISPKVFYFRIWDQNIQDQR